MATGKSSPGIGGVLVLGLVGLGVLCCAAPVLIAAGALGVLGAALHSGWLIPVAVLLVLATLAFTLARRGGGEARGCCSPARPDTSTDHHDRRSTP